MTGTTKNDVAKRRKGKPAKLDAQIDKLRATIRTDKLDLTYGEFENMYKADELVIDPVYQRLFRWKPHQKTRFIESILMGIPTPAFFVAEAENGIWELVDGLQRLSTVLEFFGALKEDEDNVKPPSSLVATEGVGLTELNGLHYDDLSLRSKLSIRRTGCRVEVLKVGSDRKMKYDLFERLNTGGEHLTAQEVRNCVFRREAGPLMEYFDKLAKYEPFRETLSLSSFQEKSLYDRSLVLRFFALKNSRRDFRHDVEAFITGYLRKVSDESVKFNKRKEGQLFRRTMKTINDSLGDEAWKHWKPKKGAAGGGFSPYIFEALAIAVAERIDYLETVKSKHLKACCNALKKDKEFKSATGAGASTVTLLSRRMEATRRIFDEQFGDVAA